MGVKYNNSIQTVNINTNTYYAIKARVVEIGTDFYEITIKNWSSPTFPSTTWTEGPPITFTTSRGVTNPTGNAVINQPPAAYPYILSIAQASYSIGRFSFAEWNDTYFMDQFSSYVSSYNGLTNSYARLDMMRQEDQWTSEWETYIEHSLYQYNSIGVSRAIQLNSDYLKKKVFDRGSELWGDTMRIGMIIVFKTDANPVEQLSLFLHGAPGGPPSRQLVVNRNNVDDAISIEMNENSYNLLQQQHLDKIDWEKPGYEYIYYAKFYKQNDYFVNTAYDRYTIQTRLIGLNNATDEVFNSVGTPAFFNSFDFASSDFDPKLYIGRTILGGVYGGFSVGYMNYFEFQSEAHSSFEIERVMRDWKQKI
jgi:hypothetical protein